MIDLLITKIRNVSIRRKLLVVLMLTISIVLTITTILLSINEAIISRQAEKDDLISLGDIIAQNVAAALLFYDRKAAEETMASLSVRKEIFSALIINRKLQVVAELHASPSVINTYILYEDSDGQVAMSQKSFDLLMAAAENRWDLDFDIKVIRPVMLDNELKGWVIIYADLSKFATKLFGFIFTIALVIVSAIVLAYALASRFQRIITAPILDLAATMSSIAGSMNYTMRVQKSSNDEIGVMIDAFNVMLEQVQTRNDQLQSQQDELQQSESKFREISRQFHALLDAMPDSIILLSADRRILWANKAAADRMSTDDGEVIGSYCFQAYFGRSAPCVPCPVERSLQSGEPALDILTAEDNKTWELRAIPVSVQGSEGVLNVIMVNRDVTEQHNLESQLQQAQKMESLGRFAGGIAHDLNNILSVIIGYSDIAISLPPGDRCLPEYLTSVIEAGQKATALTRQILAFSRKQVLEVKALNLNDVVAQMGKMLSRLIGEDIEVTFQPEKGLRNIMADASQLEQVILNLAVNARDAMPNGGVLTIKTATVVLDEIPKRLNLSPPPGEYILVSVSDTGMGMTPEISEKIFEPFFTTKERGKGTGLGLATVFGIVKQHHGYIYAESEPGKGTTFHTYFPVTAEAQTADDQLAQQAEIRGGDETILVVDDDDSLRKLVTAILQAMGYQVHEAAGGQQALDIARSLSGGIHLLLTDVVMPHKNGREVAEMIQAELPAIKVLFMSGYADEIIARNGILETGAAFLQKPISRVTLTRKVRQVLDGENTGLIPTSVFPAGRKLAILVVDDDKTSFKLVELYISIVADEVEYAENGQVAIDKFQSRPFDLVIMDMLMPIKDGCTAIREIRGWERRNNRPTTPIIMMTGNTAKEDLEACAAAGCSATIPKPLYRDKLLQLIDACFARATDEPIVESLVPDRGGEIVRIDSSLQALIPEYLHQRQEDIRSLEEALTVNDFETVLRIGHSMKGSGGSYGFDRISSIGAQIELAAKSNDHALITQWIGELAAYLQGIEVIYE